MLVLMVAGILVGGFTNTNNIILLALRRQPHSLFERWSKAIGGWTPQRRASHPVAHPKRIERGASRLQAKVNPGTKNLIPVPRSDDTTAPLANGQLQVRVFRDIDAAVRSLPNRSAWLRRVITEAAQRELMKDGET